MPRHQAMLIRRDPGCLWAKAGSRQAPVLSTCRDAIILWLEIAVATLAAVRWLVGRRGGAVQAA